VVEKFLATIVDNRRVADLPAIADAFHEARETAAGVVPATITTARPIDATLQTRLRASLERLTGRSVRPTWEVDPALVGGVVSRVGSNVYDGSLKTRLEGLRRRMAEE
jgi:F-type H+-transporting ATPase subunit delta